MLISWEFSRNFFRLAIRRAVIAQRATCHQYFKGRANAIFFQSQRVAFLLPECGRISGQRVEKDERMQGRNWKSIGVWSCMMDTVCVTKVHTVYLYGNLSDSWFRNECNEFNIFSKLQNFVNFILWYGMWLNSEHFVHPNFCSISHNYKVIYFLKAKNIKEYKYKGEILKIPR